MEFSSELLSSLIAHETLSKEVYNEREYSDYKQFFFQLSIILLKSGLSISTNSLNTL